jgi:hypothetical protein
MEETRDQQKLHGFLQCAIYVSIALEACIFIYKQAPFWGFFMSPWRNSATWHHLPAIIYSKLATFLLICLVSVGTVAKKKLTSTRKSISSIPLALGLLLFFGSILYLGRSPWRFWTTWFDLLYRLFIFGGFADQRGDGQHLQDHPVRPGQRQMERRRRKLYAANQAGITPYSVNIPTLFYFKGKGP